MKKSRLGRFVRITIGLGLLALALVITAPRMVRNVSIDAVVNGRVMLVRAPIEGKLQLVPPTVGSKVAVGQMLAEIRNERLNRGVLAEFVTEVATLEERIEALTRQQVELATMREQLESRVGAYRDAVTVSLQKERKELEARRQAAAARIQERSLDLQRQATLADQGFQSQARREQALSVRDQALAEAAQVAAAIERVDQRMEWTARGVYLGDGQNDVPYSQQRIDEISLRQQDIQARRAEYQLRVVQIMKQISAERERLERAGQSRHFAPRDGIVWKNFVADGGEVVIGTELVELLDCSDIFLDVTLDESKYEEVRPGSLAQVRLVGATNSIEGKVRSVRGSGAVTEDRLLAARVPARTDRHFQVIVDLDRNALDLGEATFCQVGRAAKVTFNRPLGTGRDWRSWVDELGEAARGLWRDIGG
jgi:multidrug resistance efflux pump